jgi:hypothetical protein
LARDADGLRLGCAPVHARNEFLAGRSRCIVVHDVVDVRPRSGSVVQRRNVLHTDDTVAVVIDLGERRHDVVRIVRTRRGPAWTRGRSNTCCNVASPMSKPGEQPYPACPPAPAPGAASSTATNADPRVTHTCQPRLSLRTNRRISLPSLPRITTGRFLWGQRGSLGRESLNQSLNPPATIIAGGRSYRDEATLSTALTIPS